MNGIVLDTSPLLPEGTYSVRYTGYETGVYWGRPKVFVYFAVVEGEYEGIPLTRHYNAKTLEGNIGPNGSFGVTDRHAIVREYRTLFPDESDYSQIDPNGYQGHLIRAKVETTAKNGSGKELAKPSRYSVIRELIEIVPEDYEVLYDPKVG